MNRRVIVVVLDGAGVGSLPDAAAYGDEGANTLGNVLKKHGPLKLGNLYSLGLGQILLKSSPGDDSMVHPGGNIRGCYGRLAASSPGKDTTSGHWELAGLILEKAFPVYPGGFPREVLNPFQKAIGRKVLGNCTASGTEIIQELGELNLETGFPIVYTSADSVFQVAAHENITSLEELYHWCRLARHILRGEHGVGRVIARPFKGSPGHFQRTKERKDFSLPPTGPTIFDRAVQGGYSVAAIGKVSDIFAHRGVTIKQPGSGNREVGESLKYLLETVEHGIIWATFGDFDTLYGHRNDSAGFAAALENFDAYLLNILSLLQREDLIMITADHGCDPTRPGSDHTREYVPVMAWSSSYKESFDLGTRNTLADLAATAARWLKIPPLEKGRPFF